MTGLFFIVNAGHQGLHVSMIDIMEQRPEFFYFFIRSRWMYSVGQQHHDDLPIGINPERSPGKAQMTGTPGRKISAAG
jgi:hypothetical protein